MTVSKYRKKPVVIQAVKYAEDGSNGAECIAFIGPTFDGRQSSIWGPDAIRIRTLEGSMQALPGDWLIQGVKGEFYPCKPDIFEATYEPEITAGGEADATD